MNETILQLQLWGVAWVITPWKLLGYLGVLAFAGRWFVQIFASHQAGQPRFPRLFWHLSLCGSLLLFGDHQVGSWELACGRLTEPSGSDCIRPSGTKIGPLQAASSNFVFRSRSSWTNGLE